VREIEFTEDLQVSILSEVRIHTCLCFVAPTPTPVQRRTRQPYGLEGGGPGGLGRNTWVKQPREADGDLHPPALPLTMATDGGMARAQGAEAHARRINVGGKATLRMGKGDRLLLETPGGGGWGAVDGARGEGQGEAYVGKWEARGSLAEREAQQSGF
jgi:5-oxoprolinase (ATP-hydrolysing)